MHHIFIFPARRARAQAENLANQQCHFKSSRWCIELLDTDPGRGTIPMEPPMSNSSPVPVLKGVPVPFFVLAYV
jgi:hypothetical protein